MHHKFEQKHARAQRRRGGGPLHSAHCCDIVVNCDPCFASVRGEKVILETCCTRHSSHGRVCAIYQSILYSYFVCFVFSRRFSGIPCSSQARTMYSVNSAFIVAYRHRFYTKFLRRIALVPLFLIHIACVDTMQFAMRIFTATKYREGKTQHIFTKLFCKSLIGTLFGFT